jgi:hypothetical protein
VSVALQAGTLTDVGSLVDIGYRLIAVMTAAVPAPMQLVDGGP